VCIAQGGTIAVANLAASGKWRLASADQADRRGESKPKRSLLSAMPVLRTTFGVVGEKPPAYPP
jgi:hypothetical protein